MKMKGLNGFLIVLFFVAGTLGVVAQEENNVYYIDVLVDEDHDIYIQEKNVSFEDVTKEVRSIVYNIPAARYQGIIYRIYGDESLKMGNIIDVGTELIRGYDPVRVERYLLNLKEQEIDGSNYLEKLKKLDLKAIDH